MKTNHTINVFTICALLLGLQSLAGAQETKKPSPSCNPNGATFNFAPLVNASLHGQANESIGFMLGRGGNGNDLVVGAALDYRFNALFPGEAYYVERDETNCAPDFEGAPPAIGEFGAFTGYPHVVADLARDAFFIADTRLSSDGQGVGIIKSTAANLLNAANCPNGTQSGTALCWNTGGVANIVPLNSTLFSPSISVDQRTQGAGAGDVYVTVSQQQPGTGNYQISLTACTNATIICSSSVIVSGADLSALWSDVQVRPDGGITISYANRLLSGRDISENQVRFVNCTPQGAPNPPKCSAPIAVVNEMHPGVVAAGDRLSSGDAAYPQHVNRLEGDGKTITTFLIYDQCAVQTYDNDHTTFIQVCPKTQVVMAFSTNSGNTWSPLAVVSPKTPGQQFLSAIALDQSTGTVNIAYYSSQNDKLKTRTQVYLAQVPGGQTAVSTINQVTATLYDGPTGFSGLSTYNGDTISCNCDYIGVAAAGTGQKGQSRVYIHFTGGTDGSFNGQAFPIYTNMLTRFDY
jgi:hypothetical protein